MQVDSERKNFKYKWNEKEVLLFGPPVDLSFKRAVNMNGMK